MEKTLDYDYIFKYILIGDASVGKSTILNRFVNDSYASESNPTMGVEFATKKIVVGGSTIKVQIWDTAGQQSFRTITRAYYKNAIGVMLVFDLNNPQTLKSIDAWLSQIHDNSNETAQIMLVGNKNDLASPPASSPKKQLPFVATSAKTGTNIMRAFQGLTQMILDKVKSGKIDAERTPGIKKGNVGSKDKEFKLRLEREDAPGENKECKC